MLRVLAARGVVVRYSLHLIKHFIYAASTSSSKFLPNSVQRSEKKSKISHPIMMFGKSENWEEDVKDVLVVKFH